MTGGRPSNTVSAVDVNWTEPPLAVWARANADLALARVTAALAEDRTRGVEPGETQASVEASFRRLTAAQRAIVSAELRHRQ